VLVVVVVVCSYWSGISTLEDEEELIDEEVVDSYGRGTWLLLDELVVVVVVVVVGPWYCEGTSLLDELDTAEEVELETTELEMLDETELETAELEADDGTELETGDCTTLLLLDDPYTGGTSEEDELTPPTLLDEAPGYTGLPANLTASVVVPGTYDCGIGFK